MFGNSGYEGYSRSKRSADAIESYEVPLSMINKNLVNTFLNEYSLDFKEDDLDFLKKLSISKWKYIAKKTYPSSWHHTSSYFNKTDHYSLPLIAERILEYKDSIDEEYANYKNINKDEKITFKSGVINVEVWGGTRKHPRIVGYDEVAGIIIGDWLYFKNDHSIKGSTSKYKTTANKVKWIKEYNSYADLILHHKEYKNTKRVFNSLIKEKISK